jgi:hypothetical protein
MLTIKEFDSMLRFVERYMDPTEDEINLMLRTNRIKVFRKNEIVRSFGSLSREF